MNYLKGQKNKTWLFIINGEQTCDFFDLSNAMIFVSIFFPIKS